MSNTGAFLMKAPGPLYQPRTSGMRLRTALALLAASASIAPLVESTVARDAEKATSQPGALTVVVSPAALRALPNTLSATGNVVAWREMLISSETTGLGVSEVLVDEGDKVLKGQTLARLNSAILRAQVAQHQASVAELQASLATAQSDLRRARTVSAGVVSEQTAEQRETLVKTTAAKLAAASAALDEVSARLRQTGILAPADSTVAARSINLGQVVQSGTEMFRLIEDGRVEVNALVPEGQIFNVRPGQSARVADPAGSAHQGEVRIVAPIVDAKTRLGTVRVMLPASTTLKPGMFARVDIQFDAGSSLSVPLKALVWQQSKPAVFKVTGSSTAVRTPVTTGRKTSDYVEILSGLSEGDPVVVDGAGLLKDGDSVRVEVATAKDKLVR
jgi:RND family efflux transporter MFP subunit